MGYEVCRTFRDCSRKASNVFEGFRVYRFAGSIMSVD